MRKRGLGDIAWLPIDASLRDADCKAFPQTADLLTVSPNFLCTSNYRTYI